mmetsp:Transcript_26311/g.40151  ORF Transcript_26311/g.40151 Transcript_26311/m.40151 type:complete len:238 (-) Transcript_26311:2287-3000(-)
MDEALFEVLGVVGVLLGGESYQTFFEEEDLEGVKAGDKYVYAEVVFEPVDKVGVRNVLGHHIPVLLVHLGLRSHNLNAFSARGGRRLHDVHVLVARGLSLDAELAVVLWEDVGLRAEVEVVGAREHLLGAEQVLPHEVFPSYLEALREMVDLLILARILQLVRLAHASPDDVPLAGTGRHDSNAGRLHSVNDRVVDVGGVVHLEAQGHVLLHHFELVDLPKLLERAVLHFLKVIPDS